MLLVKEIFQSIQGESSHTGKLFHFFRLVGCNMRCEYCDTKYAYEGGEHREIVSIVDELLSSHIRNVLITGGEPLLQERTSDLAVSLLDEGFNVLVETNGSLDIRVLPPGVVRIMDIKCPSSGHSDDNRWENIDHLVKGDEVKFVIADKADFRWARQVLVNRKLDKICTVNFSPVHGEIEPIQLADWIKDEQLPVRLNVQLHKILWPDIDKGV